MAKLADAELRLADALRECEHMKERMAAVEESNKSLARDVESLKQKNDETQESNKTLAKDVESLKQEKKETEEMLIVSEWIMFFTSNVVTPAIKQKKLSVFATGVKVNWALIYSKIQDSSVQKALNEVLSIHNISIQELAQSQAFVSKRSAFAHPTMEFTSPPQTTNVDPPYQDTIRKIITAVLIATNNNGNGNSGN